MCFLNNLIRQTLTDDFGGLHKTEAVVQRCFLENFAKFTGKQLCQSLFLNKVAGPLCAFIKHFIERNFWLSKAKQFVQWNTFEKKPPHAWLLLLFQLCNRGEVVCRSEKRVLQWIVKINIRWSNQYMLYKWSVSNIKMSMYKNQCMINSIMWNQFEDNGGIFQLTDVLKIC